MSGRPPGRPRERGEGDWLTVQEAADKLGVSYQAIHKRIQRGTIEYDEWIGEEGGRAHLRIPASALEGDVESRELDQRNAERALRVEAAVTDGIRQILQNQEKLIEEIRTALQIMREQAETEKAFQERIITYIEDQAERQHELQKEGIKERRSFWSRVFRLDS